MPQLLKLRVFIPVACVVVTPLSLLLLIVLVCTHVWICSAIDFCPDAGCLRAGCARRVRGLLVTVAAATRLARGCTLSHAFVAGMAPSCIPFICAGDDDDQLCVTAGAGASASEPTAGHHEVGPSKRQPPVGC